jgi:hypothetical protein
MTAYHRLPIAQKRELALGKSREASVVCPSCETHTTAVDLLEHLRARCTGRRDPHPSSAWVSWRAALALGVLRGTLSKWVKTGQVRCIGDVQDRRYLLRDLAMKIAQRNGFRRR